MGYGSLTHIVVKMTRCKPARLRLQSSDEVLEQAKKSVMLLKGAGDGDLRRVSAFATGDLWGWCGEQNQGMKPNFRHSRTS